jgi:hypothetical protein
VTRRALENIAQNAAKPVFVKIDAYHGKRAKKFGLLLYLKEAKVYNRPRRENSPNR